LLFACGPGLPYESGVAQRCCRQVPETELPKVRRESKPVTHDLPECSISRPSPRSPHGASRSAALSGGDRVARSKAAKAASNIEQDLIAELDRKLHWLSAWTIHHYPRERRDGLKACGHQASSASIATIHVGALFPGATPARPRGRHASRQPGVPRRLGISSAARAWTRRSASAPSAERQV
jgi:hypothetical protein